MSIIETSSFKWLRLIISFPTRSIKVMWLLNELNIPIRDISKQDPSTVNSTEQDNAVQVRFVRVESGEHLNSKLNPHPFHKVPCLEYQLKGQSATQVLFESNAIIMFLLDNFDLDKKLCPTSDILRNGQRYQIMMWVNSTLELEFTPIMKVFKGLLQKKGLNMMNKHLLTFEPEEKEEFDRVSSPIRDVYLPYIEQLLSQRGDNLYLFGNEMDVTDICLGFGLKGCDTCNLLDENRYPLSKKYFTTMSMTTSHGKSMQQMMKMFTESLSK